jgi:histidine phosphotransferase ChpT
MTDDDTALLASPDLAALLGSRLCHDLISPLGAIGNGVELMSLSGMAASPELDLITRSVANASARLRFFRVAFGQASADQRIGEPEVAAILAQLQRDGRLRYAWQITTDQPRHLVKLAFLGLLCLESALPWGGDIQITQIEGEWRLAARGARTKPDAALWERLGGGNGPITPAQLQFALFPLEAIRAGRTIRWAVTETSALISF